MNINVKRFLSFLLAFAMVLSMVPGQAFHVHAEELVETHQHTVRFLDWDGTQLQSTAVDVGAVPEYTGEPLTRASDGTYEYTFTGWDADGDALADELAPVTADVDYVALYAAAAIAVVSEEEADPTGDAAESTPAESVPADTQVTEPVQSEPVVTEPAESTPAEEESSVVSQYAISFVDWDGTLLQEVLVNEGEVPVYTGAEPVVESDGTFEAHFAGWDVDGDGMYDEELDIIPPATADATYTAAYTVIELITPEEPMLAGTLTTSVNNLGVSWTDASSTKGSANWTASGNTINGSATGYRYILSSKSVTTDLNFTNGLSKKATLYFTYVVNNATVSPISGGICKVNIEAGKTYTITLTSPAGRNNTGTITISNLSLTEVSDTIDVIFPIVNGGTYTIDGKGYTGETTISKSAEESYALVATPASGYEFFCWEDGDGNQLSKEATFTFTPEMNCTVLPVFMQKGSALFGVGSDTYCDLTKAGKAAAGGTNKVILLNNGTLFPRKSETGAVISHEIPAGVTLLIPYNDANKAYGANASCTSYSSYVNNSGQIAWVQPSPYRTLTMAADAKITVKGNIEVGGQHSAAGGGLTAYCAPTGPLGYINMLSGSHIDLESGANLYAWGYIYGDGTITAKNSSTVYEVFQVTDFRGGTATTNLANDKKVFPLNQYYVQNVEVATTYQHGAKEKVVLSVFMSNMHHGGTVNFIGDGALFQMGSESSYIVKDYIPSSDRLSVKAYGNCTLSSLDVSLAGVSVNSANFIMPITNNMEIEILSGSVITLKQDMMLLPGAKVTVCQGATFQLSSADTSGEVVTDRYALQVFSGDNWKWGLAEADRTLTENLCFTRFNAKAPKWVRPVPSTAERNHKIRTDADASDVIVDIQGTVIADGHLYTTVTKADYLEANPDTPATGGAKIISSTGTGVIQMNGGSGTDTFTKMYSQDVSVGYYDIPLASVQLTNGDGSYLDTSNSAAGTTYNYCAKHNMWYTGACGKCVCTTNGHTPGAAATCETAQTCTVCGEVLTAALGHAFNSKASANQAKAADCLNAATYYVQCDRCTAVSDSKTVAVGSANGHSYNAKASTQVHTAATCEGNAVYYVQCDNCSAVSDSVTVEAPNTALGHNWGEPSSYTNNGANGHTAHYTCANDTSHTKSEEDSHTYTGVNHTCACGEVEEYTVTWAGVENSETTMDHGSTVTEIPAVPNKPGYTGEWNIPETITGNTEITATYTPNNYSVSWIVDGKEATSTVVVYDTNFVLPTAPTKTGHTFDGWYTGEKGTGEKITADTKYTFDTVTAAAVMAEEEVVISGQTTLYANFTVNTYDVKWTVDGQVYKTTQVVFGKEIVAPENPTKAANGCIAYTFNKWDDFTEGMTLQTEGAAFAAIFFEGIKHTSDEYAYSDNDDGTHTKTRECACRVTVNEAHTYTYAADDAADTITETCDKGCGHSATITLKAPADLVYNGQKKEATVDGTIAGEYELTCSGESKNVGTYTATLTVGSVSVSLEYAITKADPAVAAAPTPVSNLTYTGEDQYLIAAGEATGGTMVYSLTEDGEYTTSIPQAKDAGTYTVYYKVLGDTNHADSAVASITATIAKANPEYTVPTGLTATYGDTLANVELPTGWAWKDAETTFVGNAGTRTFKALYNPDSNNYNTVEADITVEVAKALIDIYTDNLINPEFAEGLIYNGTAQALVTNSGSIDGGYIVFSLNPDGEYTTEIPVATEAGEYVVFYRIEGDENHYWEGNSAFEAVTIAKANPEYTVPTGLTATYGDTLVNVELPTGWAWKDAETTFVGNAGTRTFKAVFTPANTVNYNTVEADVTVEVAKANPEYTVPTGLTATYGDTLADVELPTGWAWNDAESTSVGNAGTRTFKAVFTPADTVNYNTVEADVTIEVAKAEIDGSTLIDPEFAEGLIYNGTAQALVTKIGSVDGGYIVYSLSIDGEYTTTIPVATEAGNYRVYWTIECDENHYVDGTPGSSRVTIAKADPTVTAPIADNRTYNGETKPLVTAGTTNGGTVVYSTAEDGTYGPDSPEAKNAGTYTVWYKVMGGDNYTDVDPQSIEVTIAQAPLTITAEDKTVCVGGAPELTWKVEGLMNGDTLSTDPTLSIPENCTATIGTYTITPSGADAGGNYDITYVNGTLTVNNHVIDKTTGACYNCGHDMAVATVTLGENDPTYFETLNEAVTAVADCTAEDKAVVKLLKDISLDAEQKITSGVFTLDLNDCEIKSAAMQVLNITGADVTIADSGENKTGTITGGDYGVYVSSRGTVNIEGGTITGGTNDITTAYGVYVNGGTANISGGTIEATATETAYGVYVNGGTANISGGTISSGITATETADGVYGVYVNGGTANITGGTITGGTTAIETAYGVYGMYVDGGTATITGGTITGSTCGVRVSFWGTVNIEDGTITGGVAGVEVSSGTGIANISGGKITGRTYGVYTVGTATISGGTIKATGGSGCGLNVTDGEVKITSGTITGQTGVQVMANGTATISGGTITVTASNGRGVYMANGTATISGGTIQSTGSSGRGLDVTGGKVKITSGTIEGEYYGVSVNNTTVTIEGGTIESTNPAGRGLYVTGGKVTIEGGTITGESSGVYVEGISTNPSATISGGEITGQTGVYVGKNGKATITGGEITGTSADLSKDGGTITLVVDAETGIGATFPDGITVVGDTLANILGTGASYWAVVDEKDTMLTVESAATGITNKGDITVKATCKHPEESRTDCQKKDDAQHTYFCEGCQNTITENHIFDSTDGKCICGYEMAVATVTLGDTTVFFQTLGEAVTEASNGTDTSPATLTLLKDIDLGTASQTISSGVFTIDLNDHKIESTANQVLNITGGTVTIADNGTDETKTGTISGGNFGVYVEGTSTNASATISGGTISGGSGIWVGPDGTVTITGGTITATSAYGLNVAGGEVTITGGTITTTGSYGCGVYAKNGKATISGGEITGKTGVYVANGTATITGGTIEATGQNGVQVMANGEAIITGGTITVTDSSGRGVYVANGTATISGGTIQATGSSGRGLDVTSGKVKITSGTITGDRYGVSVSNGTVTITGGTITSTSDRGLYVTGGEVTIEGGTITGDIYGVSVSNGTVTITGGTITATSRHGLHVTGGEVTIEGGTITGRSSGVHVEGIRTNPSAATISGGEITGQTGVYVAKNCKATITGGEITGTYADLQNAGTITLTLAEGKTEGATFPGGITVVSDTLAKILGTGASYWAKVDEKDTMLTKYGETEITDKGDITVRATCDHTGSQHTTITDNKDGTHTYQCTLCQNTITENHIFDSTDGKCICGHDMAVATVTLGDTTVFFQTLGEAVTEASNGTDTSPATLTLLKDIDLGTASQTISSGVFTIDLNDHKIESTANQVLTITGGTVTIADNGTDETKTGTIESTNTSGRGLDVTGGEVTITGGTITGGNFGVYVEGTNASATITGGTITGANYGVDVKNGEVTITGGTITTTGSYGYGVYVENGEAIITGGTITGGISGVEVCSDTTAKITGGKITGSTNGVVSNGTTTITGNAEITSDNYGVSARNGEVTISGDARITAPNGVYLIRLSSGTTGATIEGGTITGTGAEGKGVFVSSNSSAKITGGTITGIQYGVYVYSNGTANISGGSITGKYGVYLSGGTANISGGEISGTDGVYVANDTTIITGGTITGTRGVSVEPNGTAEIKGGSISGTSMDLQNAGTIRLTLGENGADGAHFPGGITVVGDTLNGILMEGAYWTGEKTMVIPAENQKEITAEGGEVVIRKECAHTGGKSDYAEVDGTNHSYTCGDCQTSLTEVHTMNPATGACYKCGYEMAVATVTLGDTTVFFQTLGEAVTEASNGTDTSPATLTLKADIDLGTASQTISSGVFTLDLNDHELKSSGDRVLYITGGTVTIADNGTDETKTGTITGAISGASCGVYVKNGEAIITGGEISGTDGVYVKGGTATITGGTIKATNTFGHGLNVASGEVTIEGGTITGASCGVYVRGGSTNASATISGGEITGETGVYVAKGTANIKGGTIKATGSYGVQVSGVKGIATISGGTIESAEYGVHLASYGTAAISGGTITGNNGVYVAENGTATITGGTINGANYGVGAEGTATITGGKITGTSADLAKGGGGTIILGVDAETDIGATFPGGITVIGTTVSGTTLAEILDDGASYWAKVDEKDTMLTVDDAATGITDKGDITVKAVCNHVDTEKGYTDNADGKTHSVICQNCQNVVLGKEAHGMIAATGKCICGYQVAVASVTLGENDPTYFETLNAAVTAVAGCTAEDKAVVKLLKDIDLGTAYQTISSGVFTIDLNGHKLKSSASQVLTITGGTVTIADNGTDETKTGTIEGKFHGVNVNGGNTVITGGTITGGNFGVYVEGTSTNASATISGGTISGGSGIGVGFNGTATISGGTIESTNRFGRGLDVTGGEVTITGGTIKATNTSGCGLNVTGGEVTISGGTIESTNPTGRGLNVTGGKVTINSGTITGVVYGVYVENGEAIITGGTITGTNTGVHVYGDGNTTISGGTITGTNTGVSVDNRGTANISGGTITGTSADLSKGGGTITLTLAEGKTEGATFPGGITVIGTTLANILGTGASYWAKVDEKDTMLTEYGKTEITGKGDITVKATCTHTGGKSDYAEVDGTNHSYTCEDCQNTITEKHIFDSTDGKCICGYEMAVASATINGVTTCFETLDEAVDEASKGTDTSPATLTLLKDIDLGTASQTISSGVFTIDLNGHKLKSSASQVLNITGGTVTIADNGTDETKTGTITGGNFGVYVKNGEVTISGGTITTTGSYGYGVYVENGEAIITGGTITGTYCGVSVDNSGTANITGGTITGTYCGVSVDNSGTANITGGTITGTSADLVMMDGNSIELGLNKDKTEGAHFPGGITVRGGTLNGILKEGAYWTGEKTMVIPADGQTKITDMGDITVKAACDHPDTEKGYTDNADGETHKVICQNCQNVVDDKEAHSYDANYLCICGYDQHFTVTFHANYETESTMEPQSIGAVKATALNANTFQRTGYAFLGWSTNRDATTAEYADFQEITLKQDTDLYAIWEAGPVNYFVETYTMTTGGITYDGPVRESFTAKADAEISVTPEVPEGFTRNTEKSILSGTADANGGTILKVYLDRIAYTVTYEVDGNYRDSKTWLYGADVEAAEEPEKIGYTFSGWQGVPETMPAKDVTVTGTFTANTYDAIFHAGDGAWADGEKTKTVPTDFDAEIKAPADPVRKGYDFTGWSPEVGKMDDVNGKTFTAQWKANSYNAVFDANGGQWTDGDTRKTVPTDFDADIIAPADPVREGYTFAGWDLTVGKMDDVNGKTFTAQWSANTYKVELSESYSMLAEIVDAPVMATYDQDLRVTLRSTGSVKRVYMAGVEMGGTTYGGIWTTETAENGDLIVTIPATWINKVEEITGRDKELALQAYGGVRLELDLNGGTLNNHLFDYRVHSLEVNGDQVIVEQRAGMSNISDIAGYYNAAEVAEKTGHTLVGVKLNGSDEVVDKIPTTSDCKAEFQWEANTYYVTFHANGGAMVNGDTSIRESIVFGTNIKVPDEPTREHYTFAGWFTAAEGGEQVTAETIFATADDTAVYYAHWTPVEYTLILKPGAGAEGEDITSTFTIETEGDLPSGTGYSKVGHDQNYWTTIDGDTDLDNCVGSYAEIFRLNVIGENNTVTLYARWQPILYAAHFIPGGNGEEAGFNISYGKALAEIKAFAQEWYQDVTFEKTGHTFSGWAWFTDKAGTTPYEGTTMPAHDLYLIGQWTPRKYTVTWEVNGKEYKMDTVTYGETIPVPADPVRDQFGCTTYTFDKWDAEIPDTMPAQDLRFTAIFTKGENHAWSVRYDWSEDGKTCTATRVCGRDAEHNLTETVTATGVEKTPATCEDMGWTTYTATFNADWAETQTKDVQDIPALKHDWTVSYNWSEDGKTCTATRTCGNDAAHNLTATGKVTSTVKTEATCTEKGWTTYTATFEADWAETQTKDVQDIPALKHDWTVSYQWSDDGKTCTATRACGNDAKHNLTATGKITSAVKTEATCTEKGWTTYTATFAADWAETQTKDVQDIPALKHDWTVSYNWSEDGKTCTATRTCGNDAKHNLTATGKITSTVKTEATCTEKGWTTYTATFEADWAEDQTKDVQDIPALDHDWTVSYQWSEDGKTCTATRVCGNDAKHNLTATGKVTSAVKTKATCTEKGWTTYTATFEADWAEDQTKDVQDIPALKHAWTVSYNWSEDGKTCTATRTCGNDAAHNLTATGKVTATVKTEATCTEKGWTTYTATFDADWAETQTKDVQDIPALKHDWVLKDYTVTDETHTANYVCGNDSAHTKSGEEENHTYTGEDHKCICGAVEQITVRVFWQTEEPVWTLVEDYGTVTSIPTGPAPEGHSFAGFARSKGGEVFLTKAEYTYTESIDLYPVFTVNSYTVTFTVNGETWKQLTFPYGEAVTAPDYTVPAGHTFSGWTLPDTMPAEDITLDAVLTVNKYPISWDTDGDGTIDSTEDVAYGTVPTAPEAAKAADGTFTYTFSHWDKEIVAVTGEASYCAIFVRTGWLIGEEGRQYLILDQVQKTGWTEIGTDWYYLDPETGYAATGVSRVPYPSTAINGVTYAPADEIAQAPCTGFDLDKTTGLFLFGEDGKFQSETTGKGTWLDATRYAEKGHIAWHPGLVLDNGDYYYFLGDETLGGNILTTGDVYMARNNTGRDVVIGGIYTFSEEDGKLCEYDGITEVKGILRYYEDARLMIGNGLTKVGDEFIYVRYDGSLVVNNSYWVGTNDLGVAEGVYFFNENGFLVFEEVTLKEGVYREGDAWYYYEQGARVFNRGLIEVTDVIWHDADGSETPHSGIIYIRSNGKLVTGNYYITNISNYEGEEEFQISDYLIFDELGLMNAIKNGIYAERGTLYYYQNNVIAYNAGVIQLDGNYYYVRSNGEVVHGKSYWITNVGDSGVIARCYAFDDNGVMQNPAFVLEQGIVNGYYYINGNIAYGAGLVKLSDENGEFYIYVKSNGQLATGKYWPTTTNGYDVSGMLDFGAEGKYYI